MLKLLIVLISFLISPDADAAVRSYFAPRQDGKTIAACLSDGTTCGKPVADQFCQSEGFAESILFARKTAETGQQVFARIKCYAPEKLAKG